MQPEIVTTIPEDIDRIKYYILQTDGNSWHEVTRDKRHFVMRTSSRTGFKGIRKVGYCHRSWVCPNAKHRVLSTSYQQQPNRVTWKTIIGNKEKICQICEHYEKEEACGTRKLVE